MRRTRLQHRHGNHQGGQDQGLDLGIDRPGGRWVMAAALALWGSTLVGVAGCVEQDDEKLSAEDLQSIKANILSATPAPKYAVNADLEGKVIYLGLDVEPQPVEPGKPVKLTHYWKSIASPGDGWKTFTHIEGPKNQSFINADHGPVGGKYPVSQWKPGEIIKDEHTVTLPASWAFDTMVVYTGLWRGPTRLTVKSGPSDGSGRVIAANIPVKLAHKVENQPRRYVARRTSAPIKIDGKLDEQAWKDAPSTGPFVNTLNGGPAEQAVEAKLLWDEKFLYAAFDVADTDVWSTLGKRDDKLWTQEAVELMIDADKNGKGYVELQVAPNGTVFDTYLPEYRKYEDSIDPKRKPYSWNSKIDVAVIVDGTLNKRDDKDKGWVVELALPLGDVKGLDQKAELPRLPPHVGDSWKINMFRMDQPQAKPQQASGWSPPLVGDFHALDRFGELVFGDEKGNVIPSAAPGPVAIGLPINGEKGPGKATRSGNNNKKKAGKHGGKSASNP
jgi:hypothetical protein